MRNRQPPAHYNPPPMFGLRTRWPRRVRSYAFVGNTLYGPGGKALAVYDQALTDSDVLRIEVPSSRLFVNGVEVPPLTSGTDAEP